MKKIIVFLLFSLSTSALFSSTEDIFIKERKQFGKPIRTRMPPQILIETIQKEFAEMSPYWKTFWNNFVVEDDEFTDEYLVVARSIEKPWAFAVLKEDCPKPEDYEKLKADVEISSSGTPVRIDALVGIKRKRSFFRYTVTIYEPMYPHWKNPCFTWNLPPGTSKDKFYKENYTMQVYSGNLAKKIHRLVSRFGGWKSPKKLKKIPVMKGSGYEMIGGETEYLTDNEKMLSPKEQEKILKKRRKEIEKREKEEDKKQ